MDFVRCAMRLALSTTVLAIALGGCGGGGGSDDDAPPDEQIVQAVMSISALPRLNPTPTTQQQVIDVFLEAFDLAYNAGARGQMSTWHWNDLEPNLNNYDAQEMDALNGAIANAMEHSMTQFVGIQMINTNQRELPTEFASGNFDDPAMIAQFKLLLDRVITPHVGKIKYLSIGNEVDAYLRAHPAEWTSFKAFFDAAVDHAHTLDPDIQVGVTATAEGALTLSRNDLQQLNENSDVIILTYYPIDFGADGTVTVRTPQSPANDFADMLAFAGDRPLLLQEVGYPASPLNASTDSLQAEFIDSVFSAWRDYSDDIPFLNFFVLHDFTAQICADFTVYYGVAGLGNADSFTAYLCTLGLRKDDGTPRQAWDTLQQQAAAADFIVRGAIP